MVSSAMKSALRSTPCMQAVDLKTKLPMCSVGRRPRSVENLERYFKPTMVWAGGYEPVRAQQLADRRRPWDCRFKLRANQTCETAWAKGLRWDIRRSRSLADWRCSMLTSSSTIRQSIVSYYHRTAQKNYSYRLLPRHKRMRGRRGRGGNSVSVIKLRRSITERPAEVDGREAPGHWEADFMLFSRYGQELMA